MNNQVSSLGQITSTPMPTVGKPKDWFKILLVAVGFLIALGLFGNIYLLLRKEKPKPISQITPTPTQTSLPRVRQPADLRGTPTPDPAANWKTYKDANIFFLYPNEWVQEAPQILGSRTVGEFTFQNTPLFTVSTIANYNNLTGKPYATLDEFLGVRSNQAKNTTINNYPAKRITDAGKEGHVIPYEEVALFSPDKSFLLSLYYEKDYYEKPNTNKVFDQILSTFKFLE